MRVKNYHVSYLTNKWYILDIHIIVIISSCTVFSFPKQKGSEVVDFAFYL